MVHDGNDDVAGTNAKRLATRLGPADFHFCHHANNSACTATKAGTIMHSKYALLSRTEDATGRVWTHAVWIGSANFSSTSGKKSQNNAIVIYGDTTLYGALRDELFNKQFNEAGPASDIDGGVTGDAGVAVEQALRSRIGRVDLLKVGHHGSRTSTGDAWLAELSPRLAIVSVGTNTYGHPAPEVLERLGAHHADIWRTDREGTISVVTDGRQVRVTGRQRTVTLDLPAVPADHRDLSPR
jgi:hypothetical protein